MDTERLFQLSVAAFSTVLLQHFQNFHHFIVMQDILASVQLPLLAEQQYGVPATSWTVDQNLWPGLLSLLQSFWVSHLTYEIYSVLFWFLSGEVSAFGSGGNGWGIPSLLKAAKLHTVLGLAAPHRRGERSEVISLVQHSTRGSYWSVFKCEVSCFQRWEARNSIDTARRGQWTG